MKRSALLSQIDLQEDIPSICAQKLKFGQVDLALVPVALLPELDHYHIESNWCIGAEGKVDSVKLYSEVPLDQIKEVVLDYQSKSSITLTRVLFRFFWKRDVTFTEARPGFEQQIKGSSAATVIGDRTFSLNGKYKYEFDLAEEWQKFTGLPFVFAAWVSRDKIEAKLIEDFNQALSHGVKHLSEAVKEDFSPGQLNEQEVLFYLTKRISYHLDPAKLKALELFISYIRQL